jgi:hypothetical protein
MYFAPLSLAHRRSRDAWSRRLMTTLFVTAGTMMRFTDGEHRAAISADPYDDAR